MAKREWIKAPNGALCLSGYPISITPGGKMSPWLLTVEPRDGAPYWTLESAKKDGERKADELDEFEGAGCGQG